MAKADLGLPDTHWREAALKFNTQPAGYLHDSWFDVLPQGAIARRLRPVPQAAPGLSAYLLRVFGLEHNYCEDFASPWARLALLDGPALERLFLHLGLALRHDELQGEIRGEQLRGLKQAIGAESFRFALKRVPLLGAIPRFTLEPDFAEPRTRFILIGGQFCTRSLMPFGQPLLRRMTLKLPVAWSASLNRSVPPPPSAELPPLLCKLLKDLLPAWIPLFT